MALLGGLHQRGRGSELEVRSRLAWGAPETEEENGAPVRGGAGSHTGQSQQFKTMVGDCLHLLLVCR